MVSNTKGFEMQKQTDPNKYYLRFDTQLSCRHSHFGYMESGSVMIKMDDGTQVILKQGDTYYIPHGGHIPTCLEECVMIEMSSETAEHRPAI